MNEQMMGPGPDVAGSGFDAEGSGTKATGSGSGAAGYGADVVGSGLDAPGHGANAEGPGPDAAAPADVLRADFLNIIDALHRYHPLPPEALRGLSTAEARVLLLAIRAEEQDSMLRPSDIARAGRITPSAVSQVLKGLEARGYVTRVRSEGDFRSVNVVLTDEGKALSREMTEGRARLLDEIVGYVGEDDARHFVDTWKRIVEFQERSGLFVESEKAFSGPPIGGPVPFEGPCGMPECGVEQRAGGAAERARRAAVCSAFDVAASALREEDAR